MAARVISKLFGSVVRARRIKAALTQEQIAELAGIHPTYVGMVERGERNCSIDIADSIAIALQIPLSKLISEAETQKEPALSSSARRKRQS